MIAECQRLPAVIAAMLAMERAYVLPELCRKLLRAPAQLLMMKDPTSVQRVLSVCRRYLELNFALNPLSEPTISKE